MKQKAVGVFLIIIGLLCLISAVFLKWYEGYAERQMLLDIEQNVRNSVFLVEHEPDDLLYDEHDAEILADIVNAVDQDQEVAEVTSYKNVLDIPKIECQAYIGEGTTAYNLHRGVGHHTETAKVGEIGNCVVAGHASRTFKCLFNRLEEMQIFDNFYAYDAAGNKHTYYITQRFVCSPNQLSILDDNSDGCSMMTIYTCTEGGTMRFVLVGVEFKDEDDLKAFREDYFSDKVSHMRSLNYSMSVESVSELVSMRGTKRTYIDTSGVVLRPWEQGDGNTSDVGVLGFGIYPFKEEVVDDTAQD